MNSKNQNQHNNPLLNNTYQQQNVSSGINMQMKPSYNWNSVMEYLQEQIKCLQIKESEWMIEKQQLLVFKSFI